jgi:hypothetical protein
MRPFIFLLVLSLSSTALAGRTMDGAYPAIDPTERALNLVYNPDDGGLRVVLNSGDADSPMNMMTSLQINSAGDDFGGSRPTNLTGPFDVFRKDRLFKMDTTGFGPSIDFGTPMMSNRTPDDLMQSISVAGSFLGGGSIDQLPFHLIHPAAVPEATGLGLVCLGMLGVVERRRRARE